MWVLLSRYHSSIQSNTEVPFNMSYISFLPLFSSLLTSLIQAQAFCRRTGASMDPWHKDPCCSWFPPLAPQYSSGGQHLSPLSGMLTFWTIYSSTMSTRKEQKSRHLTCVWDTLILCCGAPEFCGARFLTGNLSMEMAITILHHVDNEYKSSLGWTQYICEQYICLISVLGLKQPAKKTAR